MGVEFQRISPPSREFENLLTRALALKGIPSDIKTWARVLAESVADLSD